MSFNQFDVSFLQFYSTTNTTNSILTRPIPFGLVLTPGSGSEHNPFGEMSVVGSHTYPVTRSLTLQGAFDSSQSKPPAFGLEESYLGLEAGVYKLGSWEEPDTQHRWFVYNATSVNYTNTYNTSAGLSSTSPERPDPALKQLVDKINLLSTKYNPAKITWWDLLRRFSSTQFSEMIMQGNEEVWKYVAKGSHGPTIHPVMNKLDTSGTGLGDDLDESIEDEVVLNLEDRERAEDY